LSRSGYPSSYLTLHFSEGETRSLPHCHEMLIFPPTQNRYTMQLSRYIKIYPSVKTGDSQVLFSTKNASAIQVPSSFLEDIEKGSLSEEEIESLGSLELIVQDREVEKQEMLSYIDELNAKNKTNKYIVVLNLDCNLACTYCFEGVRKGKFFLSDDTADRFVDFVKRRGTADKKAIQIVFYGGEPLLSVDRIVSLSEKIRAFTEPQGLKYGFTLVTNGTLLTPEVVGRLIPIGLKGAKVTLDGPEHIHNRFRPFKSGAGTFEVIARNVKDVCDRIQVQIGGNYTQEHYQKFPELLDSLAKRGITSDKIPMVKFDPVINESNEFAPPDFHDGCESNNEPWVGKASLFLREEILRRGYKTQRIMPSPCLLDLDDFVVVNYDGTLYKCPGLIGRKGYCVGDLNSGLVDYRRSHDLDAWKNEECLECSYLPLCFGGCKYLKLVRDGDMRGINCQKQYFDRTLQELVSQDIAYDL